MLNQSYFSPATSNLSDQEMPSNMLEPAFTPTYDFMYGNRIFIDYYKRGKIKYNLDDMKIVVTSRGTVENKKGDAIKVKGEGANVIINKGGNIIAGDDGIQIKGDLAVVINKGIMTTKESGIHIKEYSSATVKNYGSIFSETKKGINLGDNDHSNITNYGYISAKTEGIESGSHGTVTNKGKIFAFDDDAINVEDNMLVSNYGRIESLRGDGIDMNSGSVYNMSGAYIVTHDPTQGAIDIDAADASLKVVNHGVIRGGYGIKTDDGTKGAIDTQTQTIHNYGLIHGRDKEAITVHSGSDTVYCYAGSEIIGDVDLGNDNDNFNVLSSDVKLTQSVINGGYGLDTISFERIFSYSDVVTVRTALSPAEGSDRPYTFVSLRDDSGETLEVTFAGFELIQFEDKLVTYQELTAEKPKSSGDYSSAYSTVVDDSDQFIFQPEADWMLG